jgi:hypothetical protein
VPVYAGMDNRLFKYLVSCYKYAQKLERRKQGIPEPFRAPLPNLTFDKGAWVAR